MIAQNLNFCQKQNYGSEACANAEKKTKMRGLWILATTHTWPHTFGAPLGVIRTGHWLCARALPLGVGRYLIPN